MSRQEEASNDYLVPSAMTETHNAASHRHLIRQKRVWPDLRGRVSIGKCIQLVSHINLSRFLIRQTKINCGFLLKKRTFSITLSYLFDDTCMHTHTHTPATRAPTTSGCSVHGWWSALQQSRTVSGTTTKKVRLQAATCLCFIGQLLVVVQPTKQDGNKPWSASTHHPFVFVLFAEIWLISISLFSNLPI